MRTARLRTYVRQSIDAPSPKSRRANGRKMRKPDSAKKSCTPKPPPAITRWTNESYDDAAKPCEYSQTCETSTASAATARNDSMRADRRSPACTTSLVCGSSAVTRPALQRDVRVVGEHGAVERDRRVEIGDARGAQRRWHVDEHPGRLPVQDVAAVDRGDLHHEPEGAATQLRREADVDGRFLAGVVAPVLVVEHGAHLVHDRAVLGEHGEVHERAVDPAVEAQPASQRDRHPAPQLARRALGAEEFALDHVDAARVPLARVLVGVVVVVLREQVVMAGDHLFDVPVEL